MRPSPMLTGADVIDLERSIGFAFGKTTVFAAAFRPPTHQQAKGVIHSETPALALIASLARDFKIPSSVPEEM